ncbi:AmpG family muropeptide MFS transporter [Oligoflexus tunisiensis]|uniref:AmpG family muropeptide MFS transporter n=1 Tax=Oligoflexus tunisiensis TaxID=708132 RepID=UPI000A493225|nr:AmpG family muropeptide MFS transporter [Oligoflexus tunisiensis]
MLTLRQLVNRRLLTAFIMGVASGLPLLITITLMQARAKDASVSLENIGLMSLVGLPYTLKFVWAPLFDRYALPFLGRRRGWIIATQVLLMLAIWGMGLTNPAQGDFGLWAFVGMAFLVTFFSASQDIVIDAYRREDLTTAELGLGSSYYIYGYRLGMLAVSGGGLILADILAWPVVFFIMGACLIPAIIATFFSPEPVVTETPPRTLRESVVEPFREYFSRDQAWLMLCFILLYKVGDNLAAALTTPFYLDLGFSKTEIGAIVKLFGFWATLLGSFVGGVVLLKIGINRALWLFGFLQMVSTAGFAILASRGHDLVMLGAVISFENLASGMGTAAFVAFMASLANKRFTATQYALLSSLMGVPRVLLSSATGFLASSMGWFWFFTFCTVVAVPGMMMLGRFAPWRQKDPVEALPESSSEAVV